MHVREVAAAEIIGVVAGLCVEANRRLPPDLIEAFERAAKQEESPLGKEILAQLLDNARLAERESLPACQDCGVAVVFVEAGAEVCVTGGLLADAVNAGVRQGYTEGLLRKSVVASPLRRENTGDNTPAIIHLKHVPGDRMRVIVAPKGAGSENMSALAMLRPADGVEGIVRFVVTTVERAGASACPPLVIGVGIGGNFERCAMLAKEALLRPLGEPSPDADAAALEQRLLGAVNDTGIGPGGLGGRMTALAVHVETFPCHIASLPVAVNLNCHAHRHAEAVI
ncbi:MAG: fumarate hydratase [Armatimonadota bacterium]|nr:MAG: fumarate hydratase [Armatimonadota bacterium]